MRKPPLEPCIPTRGAEVPPGPDWLHEIKHDGYRLIVQREGKRVRLFTKNGHNWTDRYPFIVETALRNGGQFVRARWRGCTSRRWWHFRFQRPAFAQMR
jgi:bifunctional non-homologous end joining protein LigD